jgi:hypothetical protein
MEQTERPTWGQLWDDGYSTGWSDAEDGKPFDPKPTCEDADAFRDGYRRAFVEWRDTRHLREC